MGGFCTSDWSQYSQINTLSPLIDRRATVDAIADVHGGTLTLARQMAAPSFCILLRDRCLSVRSLGITASDNYPERLTHINTQKHSFTIRGRLVIAGCLMSRLRRQQLR